MSSRFKKLPIRFTLCVLLFAFTSRQASAVFIPGNLSVPGSARGDGLIAEIYDTDDVRTNDEADNFIAVNLPDATFVSTLLDYPSGSSDTSSNSALLGTLLGTDTSTLAPSTAQNLQALGLVFRFSGFIEIKPEFDTNTATSAIDVEFTVGSDDGMRLQFGGITVTQASGTRTFRFTDDSGNDSQLASFESPGLYPVELLFWDAGFGGLGVEWYSSIPGGPDSGSPTGATGTVGIVPTSILSTVPEPSTALLFGFGLVGLAAGRRRG